jgi:hypothetical protein
MAVLSSTGTVTPVIASETTVTSILPGLPLDNISVYFVGGTGGGGGPLLLRLYAEVGGFQTLVALKQVVGSNLSSIIAWDTGLGPLAGGGGGGPGGGNAAAQENQIHAGGTAYIVTIEDLSSTPAPSPRQPVTITVAGVNQFDTAADMDFGALFALAPGGSASLPVFGGYAQLMDVAIDQSNIPPFFTVTVIADCGPGSVLGALVASAQMSGTDTGIGALFRDLKLPVATRYFVNITNNSKQTPSIALTGVTSSVAATSGGAVILGGDVIGPSAANTDIKWFNVPLNNAGPGAFSAPGGSLADAPIPIYNQVLNTWFAFPLSGGATMNNLGVVTLNSAGIILAGNANGPASANDVVDFGHEAVDSDVTSAAFVPISSGLWYVGMSGLTANRNVQLLDTFPSGSKVIIKDEDGSLASFDINVTGSTGDTIDGITPYVLNVASPGPFGAVTIEKNFNGEWSVVTQ